MSASILELLALLPSGLQGPELRLDELGGYLGRHYNTEAERDRNKRHALRDELYRDGGVQYMEALVHDMFADPQTRDLRKRWVRHARFNNALKRVVNEMSTVYAEPAMRLVDEPANEAYQNLLAAIRMDEQMMQIGRLLNLHRALLVGFRVRMRPDGSREPVLDIATPANVRAVLHPNDDSEVIGWLIRASHRPGRVPELESNVPKWTLWSDYESVQLRDDLSPIGESYRTHELGVIPWVPVTLGPPVAGFWPGCEGEDLVAAHLSIWFNNVLLLKESKSATKQTILTGDGTAMARGQAADTEVPTELADGQSATTVDMSMDLAMFRDTADHVLNAAGYNYGLSPAIIQHAGVQSAEARELMRMPLREIRRQQQIPLRRFEYALAVVQSRVLKVDLPAMAFNVTGWRIEFAESETPLSPMDEQTLFEKRRAAGLDNTASMMQRLHRGMTPEQAMDGIRLNYEIETERNELARPLQKISGELGAAPPPAPGAPAPPPGPPAP